MLYERGLPEPDRRGEHMIREIPDQKEKD